ncbi:Alpha/Beta hydrolase protein [Pseudomassariella vexata]|uniref:Alpha/Beta hydrolase protein n=1 Tax=Pseudomassariella vexata TaxID=1141098 RepID=A0A1Y2E7Q5_9PEZI|nr:Alpha/Beta hydrolase protein [Pseudomassariella vexata]ORY67572.1 Alpha/Beta hydrolase protein [Pseudomassariella vexata]
MASEVTDIRRTAFIIAVNSALQVLRDSYSLDREGDRRFLGAEDREVVHEGGFVAARRLANRLLKRGQAVGRMYLSPNTLNRRLQYHPTPSTIDSSSSPYGRFPVPNDPFRFIPCTHTSLPPDLEDAEPERSWAALFDPNPEHWSWGNSSAGGSREEDGDPYAGRGIYLCGYLDVPLDYTNRLDKRIARLAINKFQVSGLARQDSPNSVAGKKSERTIVLEPGGPGESGTATIWRSAEMFTNRFSDGKFDVLGFDPRGVNISLPAVSCFPYNADRDRWSMLTRQFYEVLASPRAQLEIADAMNNATFRACWEKHGDLGRFVSTAFVARDMEEIRKALGEDDLTGYLVSYGTGIGQTYANMFPDSVGRMILDGTEYVRDHRLLGGFGWTALDNGTDAWHDGFLGECLHAGLEHCALAKPRQGKSVTVRELEDRMKNLLNSLISRPVSGYSEESGPSLVTYSAVVSAIFGAMYNAVSWPALAQMLYELEDGNSTLATIMLEKEAWEYDPTLPTPPSPRPFTDELTYLVVCADSYDAPQPEGLDWWEELWTNMTTRSWVAGNQRFEVVFPCRHFNTYWPQPAEVYRGDLNNTLRNPVLLIAETYDPATPLRNGRRLLDEMGKNARLIEHHGYGHCSRDTSDCTDSIAKTFIMNGTLPHEQTTTCFANEKPYLYGTAAKGRSTAFSAKVEAWDPVAMWEEHLRELSKSSSRLLPRP